MRTSSELFQERGRSRGGRLASREQGQSRVQVSGQGVRADHDAHQRREGVPCSGWRTHVIYFELGPADVSLFFWCSSGCLC